MARYGRRPDPRWWGNERTRIIFERRASELFPDLRRVVNGDSVTYTATVEMPRYETRRVKLNFMLSRKPSAPHIIVDGPTDSPHRYRPDYDGQRLCVWYPSDPPEEKWVFEDGLLELLGHVRVHLIREALWRDTDEWFGPQAPHATPEPDDEAVV